MHNKDAWSARPVVALTANTAWNLAHFRAPLLRAFAARGAVLVALTPADAAVKKLQDMGCTVAPLPIPAHGRNPWSDVVLFWSYLRLLRRYRPAVLLSFTVKPNIYGGLAARCLGIAQIGNISGLGTAFIEGGWLGRRSAAFCTDGQSQHGRPGFDRGSTAFCFFVYWQTVGR